MQAIHTLKYNGLGRNKKEPLCDEGLWGSCRAYIVAFQKMRYTKPKMTMKVMMSLRKEDFSCLCGERSIDEIEDENSVWAQTVKAAVATIITSHTVND